MSEPAAKPAPSLVLVPAWGRFANMLAEKGCTEMELVIARLAFEHGAGTAIEALGGSEKPASTLTMLTAELHSLERAARTVAGMVAAT